MNRLRCSDVLEQDCEYVAMGNTHEEIKENMLNHMEIQHGEFRSRMGPHEKMEMGKKMEQNIK